jgi:hypothetical protein
MTEIRDDFRLDVTAALPPGAATEPVEIAGTLIADPEAVGDRPRRHRDSRRHLSSPLLGPAAAGRGRRRRLRLGLPFDPAVPFADLLGAHRHLTC